MDWKSDYRATGLLITGIEGEIFNGRRIYKGSVERKHVYRDDSTTALEDVKEKLSRIVLRGEEKHRGESSSLRDIARAV